MIKSLFSFFFAALLLFATSCSTKKQSTTIGVDPSWYPLELPGREKNVLAFSIELLEHIAKREKLDLALLRKNWDDLLQGLKAKEYGAALSTLTPYIFYEEKYSFSEPYLLTGPTLVVLAQSSKTSLTQFSGKEIGIVQGASVEMQLQGYEGLLIRSYPSVPELLKAVVDEHVDGALVDFLTAHAYLRDLFQNKLKVVGAPLTKEGLRLITLYSKQPKLIEKFNLGLSYLKSSGQYEALLHKWGFMGPPELSREAMDRQIEAFLKDSL